MHPSRGVRLILSYILQVHATIVSKGAPNVFGRGAPNIFGRGAPNIFGRGAPNNFGRGAPNNFGRGAHLFSVGVYLLTSVGVHTYYFR